MLQLGVNSVLYAPLARAKDRWSPALEAGGGGWSVIAMCVLCFLLSLQVLSEALQTANLSTSCRKTLLDVVSALLLAENVSLPETLIKETIEKVTHISSCYLCS